MLKVFASGRVGQDSTLKTFGENQVLNFSIAHQEYDKSVTWINCSMWGDKAMKLRPYILKGTYIVVDGTINCDTYMKDGVSMVRINLKVSNLEFGGKANDGNENHNLDNTNNPKLASAPSIENPEWFKPQSSQPAKVPIDDLGEDLPF